MKLHFVFLVAFIALACFFMPAPSFAAACDMHSSYQDAGHEHIVGACATSEAALQACQAFSEQYGYPSASYCHHGNYSWVWEAGWLCKAGMSNHYNCAFDGFVLGDFYHPHYFVSAVPLPKSQYGNSCNCTGDPINPVSGGVYASEVDIAGHSTPQASNRFYNSTDNGNSDLGVGWRHSFSRNIKPKYSSVSYKEYASSPDNSSVYSDPETTCTSGFSQIKSRVSAWQNAAASYANGVCFLTQDGITIGTLPLFAYFDSGSGLPASLGQGFTGTSAIGFDVTRDDGQVVSFMLNGGSIVAPPGINLKLQQTTSGFTLTDTSDNVETYDNTGKLLSVTSRTGVVQTMNYDGSGRLNSVIDNFGHQLTLGYDAQNRVISVTRQ